MTSSKSIKKKTVIKNGVFGNKKKKSSLLFRRDCCFRVFRVCRTTESMIAGAKTCSQWVFRGTSGHCSSKLNSYPKNVHDLWDCRYMQQKWASSETSLVQLRVELIFLHTDRRQLRGFSIWPGCLLEMTRTQWLYHVSLAGVKKVQASLAAASTTRTNSRLGVGMFIHLMENSLLWRLKAKIWWRWRWWR